jgi:hypothetical protein
MLRCRLMLCTAMIAAGTWCGFAAAPASAVGYYNLPGTFCQCFGYGNGAGHHACLVLGPSTPWGCCATNEVRLPYPPQPTYDCSGGAWLAEPTLLPPAGPQFAPSPVTMHPQILR